MEKQKAVDEHESNFTAGRVNVRERYLHRTGIRGRKSWIFFAILYILTLIVIVNLVVSTIHVDGPCLVIAPSNYVGNFKFRNTEPTVVFC